MRNPALHNPEWRPFAWPESGHLSTGDLISQSGGDSPFT